METMGYLKLSTFVVIGKDQHGREIGKRVTLQTRHCEYDNVDKYIAEFKVLNPNYARLHVESEFVIRDVNIVRF